MVLWKDIPRGILAITFCCDDQLPNSFHTLPSRLYTLITGAPGKKNSFWTSTRNQCERTDLVDLVAYVVSLTLKSHPVKITMIATQSTVSPRSQDSLALESRSRSIPLPKVKAAPNMKGKGKDGKGKDGKGKGKVNTDPNSGPSEAPKGCGKAKAAPKKGGKR